MGAHFQSAAQILAGISPALVKRVRGLRFLWSHTRYILLERAGKGGRDLSRWLLSGTLPQVPRTRPPGAVPPMG